MHMAARMSFQPTLHSRVFVCCVIVDDQMQIEFRLGLLVYPFFIGRPGCV